MLCLSLVKLVNWHCGVNNFWLDSLLVNDGLNPLVDMMVNVLAFNDWSCRCGVSRVMSCASVPESSSITFELLSGLASVIMLELSLLNSTHVVGVFFRENFLVLNWLDGGVIVVLVDLTVNGLGHLFMTSWLYLLLCDSGSDALVDSRIMMTGLADEAGDGCFRFIHIEVFLIEIFYKVS